MNRMQFTGAQIRQNSVLLATISGHFYWSPNQLTNTKIATTQEITSAVIESCKLLPKCMHVWEKWIEHTWWKFYIAGRQISPVSQSWRRYNLHVIIIIQIVIITQTHHATNTDHIIITMGKKLSIIMHTSLNFWGFIFTTFHAVFVTAATTCKQLHYFNLQFHNYCYRYYYY